MSSDADKLARQITLAAKSYYEGQALLTDEQFDAAVDALRIADPKNTVLKTPGWGYRPEGKITAKHDRVVGSLPKAHDLDAVQSGDIITPKLDGLSLTAYYTRGRLQRVLTRGDGTTGVVVTGRVNVPNQIPDEWIRSVRGEAVISHKLFQSSLAEDYANPRNAVSGIVNAIQSLHWDLVDFVAYSISGKGNADETNMDGIHVNGVVEALRRNRFNTIPFLTVTDPGDLTLTYLKDWADNQPYPTDGAVLNALLAIKFPTEDKETKVVKVNWNRSEKGRLIPVLEIEPLELYGTTVVNVTAYHAQFIKDQRIGPGAVVRVTKANEIIPYITVVVSGVEDVELPTEVDGVPCEWEGVHLVSKDMDALALKCVIKFVKTVVDLDGLGDKVITELLGAINVKSMAGFLEYLRAAHDFVAVQGSATYEQSFAGKLTPHLAKLGGEMTRLLMNPVDRELLLFALNMDGVGKTASRDLAPYLEQIADPPDAGIDLDADWKKAIKQNREKAIASLDAFNTLIRSCLEVLTLTEVADTKPVVLTGTMTQPRKTIVARLKQMGYREEKTVTKDTVVIASDPNGTSGKLKQARKVGAKIVTEQEFFS